MIELITDKNGWQFAAIKGDPNMTAWQHEHQSIVTDQTVPVRICPRIKPGDTVVDAGANVGSHTVSYAHAVGPLGTVYAFEPFLESYVCLAVNCRDLPQVKLYHSALGHGKGRVKLQTEANAGATRIIPKHSRDLFGDFPSADIITLDSLNLPRLDFMKVDVEGFEPLLIRGALDTITRCLPLIFIEINKGALAVHGFSKNSILNPLFDLGYKIEFLAPEHHIDMDQVDVFLTP